jgi:hypothetical protein
MPPWTVTAAINNRDFWGKCSYTHCGNQGRQELGKIFSVVKFQSPNTWAMLLNDCFICEPVRYIPDNWRLHAWQVALGSPGWPVTTVNDSSSDIGKRVQLQTSQRRPKRWLNPIQWAHWWSNRDQCKQGWTNSMENSEFTDDRLFHLGLEEWMGVHWLHR